MIEHTQFIRKSERVSNKVNEEAEKVLNEVNTFLKDPTGKSIIVIMSSSCEDRTVSGASCLVNPHHITGLVNSCRDIEKGLIDYYDKLKVKNVST